MPVDPRTLVQMFWNTRTGELRFVCVQCGRSWCPTKERMTDSPVEIHRDSFKCYVCEREEDDVPEAC